MTKKEHKYAQVLRWIADGLQVQMRHPRETTYTNASPTRVLIEIAEEQIPPANFRLKPRAIMIGDVECEAPIKELAKGEDCYLLNLPAEKLEQPAQAFMEQNDIASAVSKGMMFATPEAALAAGIAVSKLLTQQ